ncbi:MAG: SDR family oxidoreductase [Oscillochloridaceae bacterium umkhey_bin13]
MRSVLVTGGAGFIGSHLAETLLQRGDRVRILDNFSTGHRANLAHLRDDIEMIEGDLRNPAAVAQATAGVELVFHQAALPSVPRSVLDPATTNAVNITGTLNLLLAAREAQVRRVVVASSSSVYGDTPTLPKHEAMAPNPRSPYALSKLATEQYACIFAGLYPIEAVALRYFNVFGPRQDPSSQYAGVIARFCTAALQGEACTIYGDGEQSRDFTYVSDVVAANLQAAEAPAANGQFMNIACGVRTTLLDLVAELQALIGHDLPIIHAEPRLGDVRHSLAEISQAQQLIGYAPQVRFSDGLAQTLRWYQGGR